MISQTADARDAVLAALSGDAEETSLVQLVERLAPHYRRSDVSAAFWALARERQVEMTEDRRIRRTAAIRPGSR